MKTMDSAIPPYLLNNKDDLFLAITEICSKVEEQNHVRVQLMLKTLQSTQEVLYRNEVLKKEELCRLKNDLNTTKLMILDLQNFQKTINKDKQKAIQSKQDLQPKLALAEEEVNSLEAQQKKLEEDVESCQRKLKDKYYAHETAINYYQAQLESYILVEDVEGPTVTFFLLDSGKADSYFVKLQKKEDRWNLLHMNPEIKEYTQSDLAEHLKETGDIQGFLCYIRQKYKQLKDSI